MQNPTASYLRVTFPPPGYSLELRPGLTTIAVLDYSRMWGAFTSAPKSVSFVPP